MIPVSFTSASATVYVYGSTATYEVASPVPSSDGTLDCFNRSESYREDDYVVHCNWRVSCDGGIAHLAITTRHLLARITSPVKYDVHKRLAALHLPDRAYSRPALGRVKDVPYTKVCYGLVTCDIDKDSLHSSQIERMISAADRTLLDRTSW